MAYGLLKAMGLDGVGTVHCRSEKETHEGFQSGHEVTAIFYQKKERRVDLKVVAYPFCSANGGLGQGYSVNKTDSSATTDPIRPDAGAASNAD